MKSLLRHQIKDADYFITVVTYQRKPILLDNTELFWKSWKDVALKAWVILPDHFHAILNVGESNISDMMHKFKITYSRLYRDRNGPGRVWQNRFWDHVIRDEEDMNRHLDYIHYNPVKHGEVKSALEYEDSSFSDFVERGLYPKEWGLTVSVIDGEYGE